MSHYQVFNQRDGLWQIRDNIVHMYLLSVGSQAMLIDTGFGDGDLLSLTKELTGVEPVVILTHSHGDHIGGMQQFQHVFASKEDLPAIDPDGSLQQNGRLCEISPSMWDSFLSDRFSILPLPGHTPGSLGVFDRHFRRFFIGDYLSHSPVYMCLPGSDMDRYRDSLLKIRSLSDEFDELYVGHETGTVSKELLDEYIQLAEKYRSGEANSEEALFFDRFLCKRYYYGSASVLL